MLSQRQLRTHSVDIRTTAGHNSLFVPCDVSDEADVVSAMNVIAQHAENPPGLIVNCVGIFEASNDGAYDTKRLYRNLKVNAVGPVYALNAWYERFGRTNGGVVVNISSAPARRPTMDVAYGMSKAALEAATRCLARAWAPDRVWVFGVAPGLVTSRMSSLMSDRRRAALIERSVIGRETAPDEVARLIVALAFTSPELLSGSVIDASGGLV